MVSFFRKKQRVKASGTSYLTPEQQDFLERQRVLKQMRTQRKDYAKAVESEREYRQPIYRYGKKLLKGIGQAQPKPIGRGTVLRRAVKSAFPMIPRQAIPIRQASAIQQVKRGRGRPTGAYERQYAAYGGVYGYRKFVRAQRAAQRYQQQLALMQQRQAVQQQYPQQVQQVPIQQQTYYPEEVQQAQPVQQMPQILLKKPITTIFKSYGGHPFAPVQSVQPGQVVQSNIGKPYPPVNPVPLQGDKNSEWYETTDMFSGRTILKRRPQRENWMNRDRGM